MSTFPAIPMTDRNLLMALEEPRDKHARQDIAVRLEGNEYMMGEWIALAINEYQAMEKTGIVHSLTLAQYIVRDLIEGARISLG